MYRIGSVNVSELRNTVAVSKHPGMLGFLSDLYTVNLEIFARIYFRETSHMRSFVKMKPSRNGKITQSFIDIGKFCLSREFFTSLCLLMLFVKIKFSRKFPNLQ